MQNKTALWFFTALLTLACLYQLSFSWVTSSVEGAAKEVAEQKMDSLLTVETEISAYDQDSILQKFEADYLLSQNNVAVYPILGYTYKECLRNEINLGLDLQGGMNVTLEVSVVDLIQAMAANPENPVFKKSIADALIMQKSSQDDFTTIFGNAVLANDPNFKLASVFHSRENKELFPREATNDEILAIIRTEAEDAVKRTEQVLRKRIDNLGVVQPKIQRLSTSDRIVVELPGVKDKSRVRKILQGTAKLEFWETYDNREVFAGMDKANEYMRSLAKGSKTDSSSTDTNKAAVASIDDKANDLFSSEEPTDSSKLTEVADSNDEVEEVEQDLLADLASDSAASDTGSASYQDFAQENPLYSLIQPVIYQDEQTQQYYPGEGPVIGYVAEKNKDEVERLLKDRNIKKFFPQNVVFMWSAKSISDEADVYSLHAIKVIRRDGKARLEGDAISNARVTADPLGNPEITMIMNSSGAKIWREMTAEAAADPNNKKSIAVVLDNLVYSAPTVQGEIKGGQSSISGRFTPEEAEDLSNVLKAGKLPAPANIIEEAIVGPSLGHEAITSGMISFVLAFALILIYMVFYYSKAGVVADIALIANVFFVFGVLTSLGATLTLPGIAGIVLTIGMSVDANVLLYERIREELRAGKGMKLAISEAFSIRGAIPSIMDANITTGLTGIILLLFGSGPIKGFATTLIIGICTSLFSAIFLTRLIFEWQMGKKDIISFASKWTEGAFKDLNFQFVTRRRTYYLISSIIVIAGIASLAVRGLNYGVDFTGGRSYLVRFENNAEVGEIGTVLQKVFVTDGVEQRPEVKIYGSSNQVKITTKYLIGEGGVETDNLVETTMTDGLNSLGNNFEIMSSQKVEATIADDIKTDAMIAVFFSLIVIFLYILLRFRKWQYGLGALLAMFHDVLVVLGIFSLFYGVVPWSMEIDQAFIAAILTVVGYSINDTVVVFDRIREFLGLHKNRPFNEVVNDALNSTLSRTINTSLSTFMVLLMIFLFGGEVIRGFVFALMVGIVVGTYSSLCVATPTVIDFTTKKEKV
ncbi:MAG: protein translocase subunit SecDF [Flavobacteriales bacterium]|nr:protein translocase subunit SecDF [Flavobacteriales bacterium]